MRIYGLLGWTLFSAFAACQSNSNQSGSGEAKTTANVPDQTLSVLDLKGKELFKVSIDTAVAPLSKIVKMQNGDYVFSSANGIVTINHADKKCTLKIPYSFTPIHPNINYIK